MPEETKVIDGQNITIYTGDSFKNLPANLGTARDKNSYGQFITGEDISRNRSAADDMYRFQWMAKIVDIPACDMTREWRTWKSDVMNSKDIDAIEAAEKVLKYQANIKQALIWAGMYGGCAIVMSVDGHGDSSTPLDITKVQKGQLKKFIVIDRHRMFPYPGANTLNPFGENEGQPELYSVLGTQQLIHHTRMVKFTGLKLPYYEEIRQLWWGDSAFNRLYDTIKNNKTVIQSIATMIHETNIDVITADGLAEALAGQGSEKVRERYEVMALMKSLNGMMLLDGKESYERKGVDFKQLPQIMEQFLSILSAASDIPKTRFLGASPGGLNATGESDMRNYYDMVASKQNNDLMPKMDILDQVMIRSLFGNYSDDLKWEYDSLWQMTPKEQADINKTVAETLDILSRLDVPYEAILRDIQEKGLSNNLTDELIEEAIVEVPEDDETRSQLEGNNDPDEPNDDDPDAAIKPKKDDPGK